MAEAEQHNQNGAINMSSIALFARQYGPQTFGVVIFLILWKMVVEPTTTAARVDAKAFESVAQVLRETAQINATSVQMQSETTRRLERVADRLDPAK